MPIVTHSLILHRAFPDVQPLESFSLVQPVRASWASIIIPYMTTLLRRTTPFVLFRNEVTPSFSIHTSCKRDSCSRVTKLGSGKTQRPKGASNEGTCPHHRSHDGERTFLVEFRDEATRPGQRETAKIQICRASIRTLDSLRAGQKRLSLAFAGVCNNHCQIAWTVDSQ